MTVRFIPGEIVPAIHSDLIRRYGGVPGIRDRNLLASTIAQPEMTVGGRFIHRTIFEKASAYGFHNCRNHPMVEGNKRLALVLMDMFLHHNGWILGSSEQDVYQTMMTLASGNLAKTALASWLKLHSSRSVRKRPA